MVDLVPIRKDSDHGTIFLNGWSLWACLGPLLKCVDGMLWIQMKGTLLVRPCYPLLSYYAVHLWQSVSSKRRLINLALTLITFDFSLPKAAYFVHSVVEPDLIECTLSH